MVIMKGLQLVTAMEQSMETEKALCSDYWMEKLLVQMMGL